MIPKNIKYVCVDFDGTIVKHEYPNIGDPVPYALEKLKEMQELGISLILFTMRSGDKLDEAVEYLKSNRISLYGVNVNPTQKHWTKSPKAYGHLYIDDAAWGCPLIYPKDARPFVDWSRF
jgi:trehalose-6-phosphatase